MSNYQNVEASDLIRRTSPRTHATMGALLVVSAAFLVLTATPPIALIAGVSFAMLIGTPHSRWNKTATKWLLQASVIMLGFGVDLPVVLRLGIKGSLFAAATITSTFVVGRWLGRWLRLRDNISLLISAGTAICGGSAIAAVSAVVAATEAEVAVSIGTVFLLNGVALYLFPIAGHLLHLNQLQFGIWAGVAIHDVSSVIGAGLSYGSDALITATAIKLSRTLWIAPLTIAIAGGLGGFGKFRQVDRAQKSKVTIPWFIGFFLLASLSRSWIPGVADYTPLLSGIAHRGMTLVLFLIGSSISIGALRKVGWRTAAAGMGLWVFISLLSLAVIRLLPQISGIN